MNFLILVTVILAIVSWSMAIGSLQKIFKKPRIKINMTMKTPATLDEAIVNAICIGPMNEIQERSYLVLRDFIAQTFNVAYLKCGDDREKLKIVQELFESLTKR